MKPDARIFRILLDRYGLAADETVFIDDNPKNAQAASALGMHGIHFRSAAQLRARARRAWLPVAQRLRTLANRTSEIHP